MNIYYIERTDDDIGHEEYGEFVVIAVDEKEARLLCVVQADESDGKDKFATSEHSKCEKIGTADAKNNESRIVSTHFYYG